MILILKISHLQSYKQFICKHVHMLFIEWWVPRQYFVTAVFNFALEYTIWKIKKNQDEMNKME